MVAALAKRQEKNWFIGKSQEYWNRFVGDGGIPTGMDTHNSPKYQPYGGHNTLGDAGGGYEASSSIQYPMFMIKDMITNPFYQDVAESWISGRFLSF